MKLTVLTSRLAVILVHLEMLTIDPIFWKNYVSNIVTKPVPPAAGDKTL